jgi:uncharacterized membrane protein
MNLAHLHIVLNHVPSIGTVVGVVLFIASLIKSNDFLKKLSLEILVVMALVALPTYLSGNGAQQLLRNRAEIPQGLIEAHQNAAIATLILLTLTGTFAWFGLWQFRRLSRPGLWNSTIILILSIMTAGAILQTANQGGKISHPEIRTVQESVTTEAGWRESVSMFVNSRSWVWPASETLHFIGMTLLFGVALVVNLRMLGMMKSIPFAALHRLLPLGILGFILNVVTGMVFFMASPEMYIMNQGFSAKIFMLILAGITVIYFTVFDEPWAVKPESDAPFTAKLVALSTTCLLLGTMYFGRMLPFLRN